MWSLNLLNFDVYKQRYKFDGSIDEALYFTGANPEWEEKNQPAFMKSVGLLPSHKFLDLGCGCLRGTLNLIDYLHDGNFYGADVSEGLIESAEKRVINNGIVNTPILEVIDDFELEKVFKDKFDYILSVSLLTHLFPDAIPYLFHGVSKVLSDKGEYYFTIYPLNDDTRVAQGTIEIMRYNRDFLKSVGKEYGLIITDLEGDYENPVASNQYLKRTNTPYIAQWVMKAVKA